MPRNRKTMPPIHPGETLREDFMKPLGLTANRLAINLRVPAARIGEIVNGRRAITPIPPSGWHGTLNEPAVLD